MSLYCAPTAAQIDELINAAACAVGSLDAAAFLLELKGSPDTAKSMRKTAAKLNATAYAVLGRPAPAVLIPDAIPQLEGENTK